MCPLTVRSQLATRNIPFPELTDANVMILVLEGERPPKPHRFEVPGMTPEVWKIAEMCWHEKPKKRPEVRTVLQHLQDLANPGARTYIFAGCPYISCYLCYVSAHREHHEGYYKAERTFVPGPAALFRI